MPEEDIKSVVIATTDCEKALYIIAKDAMLNDSIELHFMDKYAPTVEYLLRILRKAFGWIEQDRGTKVVINTKCRFNINGFCAMQKNLEERGLGKEGKLRCVESVRLTCPHYKRKFDDKINVNYVLIEKVGQAREL